MIRALEAHSGISALLVEKSDKYQAIWISSLTHSASKGLPDNELISLRERIELVREIRSLTTKLIIVDIDTGGDITHLPFIIKGFKEAGAYAVIMEDKRFPKQNSLLEEGKKDLEDIDVFADKISIAKKYAFPEMKVFARLESLIAKKSKYEALLRAEAYMKAGADGIMVHSKIKVDPTEVIEIAEEIKQKRPFFTAYPYKEMHLIAVPTTYKLPEEHPFDIVIDANHMFRASLKAMQKVANGEEVELASVEDIFNIVGK